MTATMPEADKASEIDLYFELAGYRADDTIGVCWTPTPDSEALHFTFMKVSAVAAEILKHQDTNCWMNAAIFKTVPTSGRGKREHMGRLPSLYADLDFKCFTDKPTAEAINDTAAMVKVISVINAISGLIGERPTVILYTVGGMQPRWLVDGDVDDATLARFGKLVKQVAEKHGGTADSVFDKPRLLRAPGSVNSGWKQGKQVYPEPRPTQIHPVEEGDAVDLDRVVELLDARGIQLKKEDQRPPALTTPLTPGRGHKYAMAAMQAVMAELEASKTWPEDYEDMATGRGRGWEKFQADAAYRLASLALASWNDLTMAQARQAFLSSAPTDSGWTFDHVSAKWDYQEGYAVAADRPDDIELVAMNLIGVLDEEDIERLTRTGRIDMEENLASSLSRRVTGRRPRTAEEDQDQEGKVPRDPEEPFEPEPQSSVPRDPEEQTEQPQPDSSPEPEQEQLPWPDGFTEADLLGIYVVRVGDGDAASLMYQYPRGARFEISTSLEQRVEQYHQIVITEHTGDHMEIRVPWCTVCEARARGVEPLDQTATIVADARLRWQLQLRSKLPKATIPADDEPFLGLEELMLRPPALYLIEGVLPQHGVGVLTARDSMGKTFFAIDIAMAVTAGLDTWHGRDIDVANDGGVIYLMGEGASAAPKRLGAWLQGNPLANRSEVAERLLVRPGSVNLFTGGPAFEELYKLAKERRPDLITVDTLQTNSVGADSNSTTDMGIVHSRLRALQRACGGVVLVLAHTGKTDRDARGSSAIEDDADFVMHVDEWNAPGVMKVSVTKMKDGPEDEIVLKVEKLAESLVLKDKEHLGKILWSTADIDARIKGVLRELDGEGPQTLASIMAGLVAQEADNPKLKKAHKGTVHRHLVRMADFGDLVKEVHGQTTRYGIPVGDPLRDEPGEDHVQDPDDLAPVLPLFPMTVTFGPVEIRDYPLK